MNRHPGVARSKVSLLRAKVVDVLVQVALAKTKTKSRGEESKKTLRQSKTSTPAKTNIQKELSRLQNRERIRLKSALFFGVVFSYFHPKSEKYKFAAHAVWHTLLLQP